MGDLKSDLTDEEFLEVFNKILNLLAIFEIRLKHLSISSDLEEENKLRLQIKAMELIIMNNWNRYSDLTAGDLLRIRR